MRVFLDSDVILDSLLKRPDLYLPATNIFTLAYEQKIHIVTSAVAFANIHYFLDKFDKANKLSLLTRLRKIVNVLKVDEAMVDAALTSGFTDIEDAMQFFSALAGNADMIITRNIKDYKNATLPVLTPEQFLNTL